MLDKFIQNPLMQLGSVKTQTQAILLTALFIAPVFTFVAALVVEPNPTFNCENEVDVISANAAVAPIAISTFIFGIPRRRLLTALTPK